MCIIAVKKEGVKMPKEKIIRKMFSSNSDGAGLMIKKKHDTKIRLVKGLMTIDGFLKAIASLEIEDDDIVVMHFRIATIGGKLDRLTHPFVGNADKDLCESTNYYGDELCFAHNGTLSSYSHAAKTVERSDTSLFASMIMSSPVIKNNLNDRVIKRLLEDYIGSGNKLAVINPNEHNVHLFGSWSSEGKKEYLWNKAEDGMIYSNFSWEVDHTPFYWGYSDMYSRNISEVEEVVPKDVRRRNNKSNSKVGKVVDINNFGRTNEELFSDDDSLNGINTTTVMHIMDDIRALSEEEYESWLDYIGMRKHEFEKEVREGVIGLTWYIKMQDEWMDKLFEEERLNEADENGDVVYRSGVIVTDKGREPLKNSKKK